MTRDEAMRAAIGTDEAAADTGIAPLQFAMWAATAGADAELARVVEWLRERPWLDDVADALAARAHWKDEQ